MPTRAAIYARISVDDKKTPAVKLQIKNLTALAASEGYTVVRTYSDDGISAFSGKTRPGFLDLVSGIRAQEFDVVLAVAEDRLTRSSEEKIGLQSDCVKAGITWHTIAGGRVDPSTASGGLLATITGAVAQYESQIKQERIRRSVADRLAAGKDLGGPRPFGFEPDRRTLRESEAELLRTAYSMVLEGESVYSVAKLFTDNGVRRDRAPEGAWRPQTVRSILLRPRNAGRLVVGGVQYADDRTRIVEPEVFEQVRAILENPGRAPKRGPKPTTWAAVGTVRCGVCGGYLSQSGARLGGHRNFRCAPDGRPTATIGKIHPTITATALDRALSGLVRAAVTPRTLTAPESSRAPVAGLRATVAELVRQRDLAQDLALEPGVNLAQLKKKISSLGQKIEAAQGELDAALSSDVTTAAVDAALAVMVARDEHDDYDPDSDWAATSEVWDSHWQGLSVDDKRALILGLGMRPLLWPTSAPRRLTNGPRS